MLDRSNLSESDVVGPQAVRSGLLVGQDIVCLALRQWDGPWKNNQQVMSVLARTNQVLYVGPQRSFRESLRGTPGGTRSRLSVGKIPEGLHLYQEPWFLSRLRPTRWGAQVVNPITARKRLAQVRRMCRQLSFGPPILWVYDPGAADVVGSFGERLVVYHVIDNYEHWAAGPSRLRALASRNHGVMLERADIVFTVSEALHRRCIDVNPNSHVIPNGVDYPLFAEAMRSATVPVDMAGIPHPIIGYVGALQPRIDFDLLRQMAASRPGWSFVLVGPFEHLDRQEPGFRGFTALDNVHYLGPKEPREVPFYMKACDVGILPYRSDDFTAFGDSLKQYEYLAAGLPVVSSDMPSSRRLMPFVYIARNQSEFLPAVEAGLREGGARIDERRALAERHSWDRRVERMSVLLAETVARSGRNRRLR